MSVSFGLTNEYIFASVNDALLLWNAANQWKFQWQRKEVSGPLLIDVYTHDQVWLARTYYIYILDVYFMEISKYERAYTLKQLLPCELADATENDANNHLISINFCLRGNAFIATRSKGLGWFLGREQKYAKRARFTRYLGAVILHINWSFFFFLCRHLKFNCVRLIERRVISSIVWNSASLRYKVSTITIKTTKPVYLGSFRGNKGISWANTRDLVDTILRLSGCVSR